MEKKFLNRINVNILTIIGISLGIIALFLIWTIVSYSPPARKEPFMIYEEVNFFNFLEYSVRFNFLGIRSVFIIGCVLYVIGLFSSFLTPLGGIPQLAGILIFFGQFISWNNAFPSHMGPYLGIVSVVIVLISLFKPIRVGKNLIPTTLKHKLLTINFCRK